MRVMQNCMILACLSIGVVGCITTGKTTLPADVEIDGNPSFTINKIGFYRASAWGNQRASGLIFDLPPNYGFSSHSSGKRQLRNLCVDSFSGVFLEKGGVPIDVELTMINTRSGGQFSAAVAVPLCSLFIIPGIYEPESSFQVVVSTKTDDGAICSDPIEYLVSQKVVSWVPGLIIPLVNSNYKFGIERASFVRECHALALAHAVKNLSLKIEKRKVGDGPPSSEQKSEGEANP